MSVTVVSTPGDPAANSFVSVAEADAYLNNDLNASAWTGESNPDQKSRAVIAATRELTVLDYIGLRQSITQALAWPRRFANNPDSPFLFYYDADVIPDRVKNATCDLALEFLKAGTTDIAALDSSINIIEKDVDVIKTRYAEPWQRARGLRRFPKVTRWLGPLMAVTATTQAIVRG